MNVNPSAISILCYGDSNTYGQKPDKSGRYPSDIRWTGKLQNQLGNGYYIVEEGLGGRTTNLEHSTKPGRNGKTYLVPCLQSQNPIEMVILMLGTNDLKIEFDRSSEDIASAIEDLIEDIQSFATNSQGVVPKILIISPAHINDKAPTFAELYAGTYYDNSSTAKSKSLAGAIKSVADKHDCLFLDASTVSAPGEDGIHLSVAAHSGLANALVQIISGSGLAQ